MEVWIGFTLAAAFAQTLRFMLQKSLKTTQLSTAGATFARFIYSAPLIAILVLVYGEVSGQDFPNIPPRFWAYALSGGLAQILATMCVVALFARRNFAVGITFKKTEVMQTALLGFVILGESVAPLGWLAIGIGFCAVLLLSPMPQSSAPWHRRFFNPAAGLGLLSGVFFAVSAVGYRGASLSLETGDAILSAAVTLALVTASQTVAMALYLGWFERGEMRKVAKAWRVAGLVGITSMIGSFCWFTAFTLQNAAYVNALGQVELLFSLLASVLFFRERISRREMAGIALLLISILILILVL
ncbi:MAG: drug/metabolite transporter (DMT)-like permease [Halocynthiibacter sp.]|jgi:drug/metabolite transporter (DMT)-like permease